MESERIRHKQRLHELGTKARLQMASACGLAHTRGKRSNLPTAVHPRHDAAFATMTPYMDTKVRISERCMSCLVEAGVYLVKSTVRAASTTPDRRVRTTEFVKKTIRNLRRLSFNTIDIYVLWTGNTTTNAARHMPR